MQINLALAECQWMRALLFAVGRPVFLLPTENTGDLKTPAEGLVKQHSGLEFRDEREPCQKRNRSEEKQAHKNFITTGKSPNGTPKSSSLNCRLTSLSNLRKRTTIKIKNKNEWEAR